MRNRPAARPPFHRVPSWVCLIVAALSAGCGVKESGIEIRDDLPSGSDAATQSSLAGRGGQTPPGRDAGADVDAGPVKADSAAPPDAATAPPDTATAPPDTAVGPPDTQMPDVSAPPDFPPAPIDTKPPSLDEDHALVGWWRLDEGAQAVLASDSSRFGNDAKFLPGDPPVWDAGKAGQALDIRRETQPLIVDESPSVESILGDVTLAAWVRPATGGADQRAVLSRQSGTGSDDLFWLGLGRNSADPTLDTVAFNSLGTGLVVTKPLVRRLEWTHVAATYDGAALRLYVNGRLEITHNKSRVVFGPTGPDKNDVIVLGGNQNDSIGYPSDLLNGLLDDVRLYARALTEAEVAALAR